MKSLRMAVVGVGSLGQHHAAKLAGFDDVELVGVADPGEQHGRLVADRCDTAWYRSARQLPDDLDGVVIATPTKFHPEAASQFLEAGIPTFVEKPLAASLSEARQLMDLANRHGAILQVGHIERFNPAFQLARSAVGTHCIFGLSESARTHSGQPISVLCMT
ncbi:MAG: Gfo/Idh/MocA family oxidoreductase [Planctomycetaceae bacterium]